MSIDEARADTVRYMKALIANRTNEALQIERKYGLAGYPPEVVSVGLQAATEGRDHLAAVDEYLEDEA